MVATRGTAPPVPLAAPRCTAVHMVAARGTAPPVPLTSTMCMAVHMVAARETASPVPLAATMCMAVYTWWLLGLAVKGEWLAPGGPILDLVLRTGLENSTVTL